MSDIEEYHDLHSSIKSDIKHWRTQDKSYSCMPTCLHNIISEVASRKDNAYKPFAPKYEDICKWCEMTRGGTIWDDAFKAVRTEMLRAKVREWSLKVLEYQYPDPQKIKDILLNKGASYPFITLEWKYLADRGVTFAESILGRPCHTVIVIDHLDGDFIIYDPYVFNDEVPIKRIYLKSLVNHWGGADPKGGIIWLEKENMMIEGFDGAESNV